MVTTSSRQGFHAGGFQADYAYDRDGKVTGIKHGKSSRGTGKSVSYAYRDTGEPSLVDLRWFAVSTAA